MARYTERLASLKPRYFYGYVSMLVEYAQYFRSVGRRAPFQLQCIITTAEVLTQVQRDLLKSVFGTPVFNEYGCGELGTIAHECEQGNLHLSEENMIVEIMDGESVCPPGSMGEIVITELNNLATPLIRYRTGDYGALDDSLCGCGRTLRVLKDVYGRAYDFVVNRQGEKFHAEFIMYIFEDALRQHLGVRQFQVVQRDFDDFLVRFVPNDDYNGGIEELVESRLREKVDPEARVTLEQVENIERERSGKIRLIVGLPPRESSAD